MSYINYSIYLDHFMKEVPNFKTHEEFCAHVAETVGTIFRRQGRSLDEARKVIEYMCYIIR